MHCVCFPCIVSASHSVVGYLMHQQERSSLAPRSAPGRQCGGALKRRLWQRSTVLCGAGEDARSLCCTPFPRNAVSWFTWVHSLHAGKLLHSVDVCPGEVT